MSVHSVFVLDATGKPLTPTTPAKARKLLRSGVAKKVWSKLNMFGLQMLGETRQQVPVTTLGIDPGTKFEGYAVVCGQENVLAIKLDLSDKQQQVKKMQKRQILRRARRFRKCRRRPARFDNRSRKGFIAPSQLVMVCSRLKVLRALFAIYPIGLVGLEDVRFYHAKHRWGANFSTVEIGKTRIRQWIEAQGAQVTLYQGFETQELRKQYGYRKTSDKAADRFEAHCADALALACAVGGLAHIEPGTFRIVDDTYRPIRRKLHDEQPAKGGIRAVYSHATIFGVQKGRLIGARNGNVGQLCGETTGSYRYYTVDRQRKETTLLRWISTQLIIRKPGAKKGGKRQGASR